jgi:hypothetical protein
LELAAPIFKLQKDMVRSRIGRPQAKNAIRLADDAARTPFTCQFRLPY